MTTLVLSAAMLISGTVGAQAVAASDETVCEDQASLDLSKLYRIANDGTENPAESFHFNIEKVGASKSLLTLDTMPSFAQDQYSVDFSAGEATKDGTTKTTVIDLPEFANVGVYTYRITEVGGNTAGVSYGTDPVLLTVTVTNCSDGSDELDRHYVMALEDTQAEKVDHFENTYGAGDLTVEKKVTGILGDKQKVFHVNVEFTAPANETVKSTMHYTDDNEEKSITPDQWQDGRTSVSITVKHGEKIEFSNIPYGVTYTVSEVEANQDDYATSITYSDDEKHIDSALDEVTIVNDKGGTLNTGLTENMIPYAAAAALIVLLSAMLVIRRKQIRK